MAPLEHQFSDFGCRQAIRTIAATRSKPDSIAYVLQASLIRSRNQGSPDQAVGLARRGAVSSLRKGRINPKVRAWARDRQAAQFADICPHLNLNHGFSSVIRDPPLGTIVRGPR
jgi:hypothetical protein